MRNTTKLTYTITLLINTLLALGIISLIGLCAGVSILFWQLSPFFLDMPKREIVLQEQGEQKTDFSARDQVAHELQNHDGHVALLPQDVDKEPRAPMSRSQSPTRRYVPTSRRSANVELPAHPPQPAEAPSDAEASTDTAAVTFQTPEEAVQLLSEAQPADLDAETLEILREEYRLALQGL
jgi:hypothetical protein